MVEWYTSRNPSREPTKTIKVDTVEPRIHRVEYEYSDTYMEFQVRPVAQKGKAGARLSDRGRSSPSLNERVGKHAERSGWKRRFSDRRQRG